MSPLVSLIRGTGLLLVVSVGLLSSSAWIHSVSEAGDKLSALDDSLGGTSSLALRLIAGLHLPSSQAMS